LNQLQEKIYHQEESLVSEIETYIIKINFEANIGSKKISDIQNEVEFIVKSSSEERLYVILNLLYYHSIDLEAKLKVIDRLKSTNKIISLIVYGLPKDKRQILNYIHDLVPHIPIFSVENEAESILKARELKSNNKMTALSLGPSVFTGVRKDELVINGKMMIQVHNKKWNYRHPDDTYFFKINLLDSDVFISKLSGFLSYRKVVITNVLFDRVVNKVVGPQKQYFQIIDCSNVLNSTINIKRNIIHNMERTEYIVFYGLSAYMKIMLNLSKQFYSNFKKVMIANSYEEAVTLVLERKYGKNYFKPRSAEIFTESYR